MPNVIISPNMSLPIPVTGVDPGPDYANNVNSSLLTIDGHNHSFGSGVQVPTSGLNINTDLTINGNSLTNINTLRFMPNSAPITGASPNLGCLYEVINDLFYNDGLGNQIRITQSGGIAGSPGSISGLVSPASATYSPGTQTFIWQSNTNTAANMDNGSVTIREVVANAKGVTLSSPSSLAADYTLTFPPALPGSTSIVTIDSSGNIATPGAFPINAADIASNAVTTSKIIDGAVTVSKMAAPNMVVTSSSGAFTYSSSPFVQVTNLFVTITTSGKPVMISFQPEPGTGNNCIIGVNAGFGIFAIVRDTSINLGQSVMNDPGTGNFWTPPGSLNYIDPSPSAGVHTYQLQVSASGSTVFAQFVVMVVREL